MENRFFNSWTRHFPPLLPILIAFISRLFAITPLESIKLLNPAMFAGSIFLTGLFVYTYTRDKFFTLTAAMLFLTSAELLIYIYSMVWSEAPFIFFLLLSLILLYRSLKDINFPLVFSALAMSLAFADRYLGLPFVISSAFLVFLFYPGSSRQKIYKSLFFAFVSCIPILIWTARNMFYSNIIEERSIEFTAFDFETLRLGFITVSNWFLLSENIPYNTRLIVFAAGSVITFGVLTIIIINYKIKKKNIDLKLPLIALISTFFYVFTLILSKSVFEPLLKLDIRHMIPIYPFLVFLVMSFLYEFQEAADKNKLITYSIKTMLIIFILLNIYRSELWLKTIFIAN